MSRTTTPNVGKFGIRGKDEKGGLRPPFFCSAICGRCHRERIQDVAPQGGLMLSQSKKRWRGRLPPAVRRLARVPAPLGFAPPRPRYWILRRPRRQRRGAPARRPCGGRAACVSRRRPDLVGGRCRRRSSVVGCPPASYGGRGAICRRRGRGAAVAAARGRAVPLRCTLGPGRRPRPRCAPLRLRARGWGFRRPPWAGGVEHLRRHFHIFIVQQKGKGNDHAQHLSQSIHAGVLLV